MAAVEKFLVAKGWHIPRWRTTNKEYGKFCEQKPRSATAAQDLSQHFSVHRAARVEHVLDYINCNDRCYLPHLRQHSTASGNVPSSSSSSGCENASLKAPFVRCCEPTHRLPELNPDIQLLPFQEDRTSLTYGPEQLSCLQNQNEDGICYASSLNERPPWKPKPLKPMILFEKKAKELEKESALDRQTPYKRKNYGGWLRGPSPPSKRHQVNHDILPETRSIQGIHPASRRYNYYKYYGYGGHGAKTSWGHNLPLGQKPPFSNRTRELVK